MRELTLKWTKLYMLSLDKIVYVELGRSPCGPSAAGVAGHIRMSFAPRLETRTILHIFQPLSIILFLFDSCARMNSLLTLLLLSAYTNPPSHAAAIPHVARQHSTAGTADQPPTLSTEALLTLIGVCVAVLGLALSLVLSWPSLKITLGRCTSRRSHSPSLSTGTSAHRRWHRPAGTNYT